MKTFRNDFFELYKLLKNNIPFAFVRFSDGEEVILQNKSLQITNDKVIFGDTIFNKGFPDIDHKNFDPNIHQATRKLLQESFYHQQNNYYKGVLCKCCVGDERCNWMLNELKDHKHLTWANLLVNNNYDLFLSAFIPEFKNRDIIIFHL